MTASWGRARLLAVLCVAVGLAALLTFGLGHAVWTLMSGNAADDGDRGASPHVGVIAATGVPAADLDGLEARSEAARGPQYRDVAAAEPMMAVPDEAALSPGNADPAPIPTQAPTSDDIEIPVAVQAGPANVLTGFPPTPQGAVGQLAQIEVAVLQAMSVPETARVHAAWALPGGVAAREWALARAVEGFLTSAGMSTTKPPGATVAATPVGALVKATDGPDWVVACVLLRVSADYLQHSERAYGHCERMQWAGGRWLVAPGEPPASAPSAWPGTPEATTAGWLTWTPGSTSHIGPGTTYADLGEGR